MKATHRLGSVRWSGLALCCFLALIAGTSSRASASDVSGQVRLAIPGTDLRDVGPIAVYLVPTNEKTAFSPPDEPVEITQKDATFVPAFAIAAAGQILNMFNGDSFFHSVFSYSEPNAFNLGLYPMGESRQVTLVHPGVVRIYCSIHETMRAVVVVSPSPWFDRVGADGRFLIESVPPGDYLLRSFNELLPDGSRRIAVGPRPASVVLDITQTDDGS